MAKKSRRVRRKGVQPRLSRSQLVRPVSREGLDEAPAVELVQQSKALDFGQEYRYVVSDLQRIGILAAVMLGGLAILSFIL
ncbi:MAG: hypothetical protein PVF45_14980 [Anaerolineae bacterium]|jgi:hypothetical protein